MSQAGTYDSGTPLADIEIITGDTGLPTGPDAGGEIHFLGDSGIHLNGLHFTSDPATNTVSAIDLRNITKYVVDSVAGETSYTTIQSAITAANTAGLDATIYIRPGAYTENLTLYDGIDLVGAQASPRGPNVNITGTHVLPASGNISIKNLSFTHTGNQFAPAGASSISLSFDNCRFNITTSGRTVNIPGSANSSVIFNNCLDVSTVNGIYNNASTGALYIYNSTLGADTTLALTIGGNLTIEGSRINCSVTPVAGNCNFHSTVFTDLISTVGTGEVYFKNCALSRSGGVVITHNSTGIMQLIDTSIDCDIATVIAGAGDITFSSVSFLDGREIAGTIGQDIVTVFKTNEIHAENIQNQIFSGFMEFLGAGVTYTLTGTTVTLEKDGWGYIHGKRINWTSPQIVGPLAAGDTYFLYIDDTGTFASTTTRTNALFEDNIVLFEVLVDSTPVTPILILIKENHPYKYPTDISNWAHNTIGTVISNINYGANIALNGTKAIQIDGTDYLEDHGLITTIPDSAAAAVNFSFMYTNGAGKWVRDSIANTFPNSYNNAGTVTALTAGKYGIFRLYVSKDSIDVATPTYYAVLDDAQYNNIVQAQTAISNNTPAGATNELFELEMAQLGFIIKEQSSDTIVDVIIDKEVASTTFVSSSSNQASLISTLTTNFDCWLSAADTTVQAALETLDDVGKGPVIDPVAATDSFLQFDEQTVSKWRIGNDATDDSFRISQGTALGTNDTQVIQATGEINYPLQCSFLAFQNTEVANVTGNGAVYEPVSFNTEVFDQNADYNNGTFTFTAPVTGRYLAIFNIRCDDFGTCALFNSYLNTSNALYYFDNLDPRNVKSATGYCVRGCVIADMDAADTAIVRLYGTGALADQIDVQGAASPNLYSYFNIQLIA